MTMIDPQGLAADQGLRLKCVDLALFANVQRSFGREEEGTLDFVRGVLRDAQIYAGYVLDGTTLPVAEAAAEVGESSDTD